MSISVITVGGNPVTVVQLPAKPGLKLIEWDYWDAVASVRSIFTGQTQRQKWLGADKLSGTATLPPLTVLQADDWESFQMQLRGTANAFQMGDPLRTLPRGSGGTWPNAPLVDNTVPGGNAAGSEMLGTKGWIPSTLILRRGDWMQVGFRLYRVLDDVTSDGSGKAVIPVWPTLREQPNNDGSSAPYVNATGTATKSSSSTLAAYSWGVIWSDFSTPALPSDAVIQGIYPVIIASGVFDICFQALGYGASLNFGGIGGGLGGAAPFTNPYSTLPITPGATFASTEFYAASLGTSLSVLTAEEIGMVIYSSLLNASITDSIAATGVGFAIYYTSATPVTDPQMPPPFTVPGGQGLAWSLPFQFALGGPPFTIGTAVGSGAIDNGTIILNNPRGLFSMASNKRASSADPGRLSRTSFPFEEYR